MNDSTDSPPPGRTRRSLWSRHRVLLGAVALVGVATVTGLVAVGDPAPEPVGQDAVAHTMSGNGASTGNGAPGGTAVGDDTAVTSRCPWLERAMDRHESPAELAASVVARMTTDEKLGELVLDETNRYENIDAGVPRLCIPPLTLQDGPQGVAFGAIGVTQLPAPLGVAATFDPSVARAYGQVEGAEATGQGIDVVQGPNLNIDRVPESGRAYEGFGEDPTLVSAMGVADIEGIQSEGAMAMAKHFAVYSQETDRGELNDLVSPRALEELYFRPFEAAVSQAHVASVMCAYPKLDGTFQCQDPSLLGQLQKWGFTGFVRSDLGSVHDPVAAIESGTDLLKPAQLDRLAALAQSTVLPASALDADVTTVLTAMFTHGLVGRPPTGSSGTPVDTAAHAAVARQTAERSAVLLKDSGGVLPLAASPGSSVAVIGADAGSDPSTTGYGSSAVTAPFVSTPLAAIRHRAGTGVTVTYSDGGSSTDVLPAVPPIALTPADGIGHGLTFTLTQTGGVHVSMQTVQPTVDTSLRPHLPTSRLLPGAEPSAPVDRRHRRSVTNPGLPSLTIPGPHTRSGVVLPAGWSDVSAVWTGTLTPPRTGLYTFSLQGSGAATLNLDGVPAVSDPLSHARGRWSQTVPLTGGHPYRLQLDWEPVDNLTPSGESTTTNSLTLGWAFVSDQIAAAVAAARKADVAVVFAGDFTAEAFDRPSLSLPGDEDELISAVAAANPRTVVVLNTGGPVLMPWLDRVSAVVEAWYPGEEDGNAIAAVLFGDVDPSGHLPVTFPASAAGSGIDTLSQWPGVDLSSTFSEGLDVGYRYGHATGVAPLFPFGFGLSYTGFSLGALHATRTGGAVIVRVRVTDTGTRSGTAVPQVYLTFPPAADEPPAQLVAFAPVALGAGRSRLITLTVPDSMLRSYLGGAWTTVPGDYTVSVGQSSADLPLSTTVPVP
ncbi:MAG: glycoside hydrolase family 3 protein [Acidimicrobiales bacterium]